MFITIAAIAFQPAVQEVHMTYDMRIIKHIIIKQ